MPIKANYRIFPLCCFVVILFLAFPDQAHAGYLDPGSGSTLAQVIIAAAAGIRRFWAMLLAPFSRFLKK